MKICLVANDYSETLCLEKIGLELRKSNHEVYEHLGRGGKHLFTNELYKLVLSADLLIVTISEYNHIEVHSALALHQLKPEVPIVVYAPGRFSFGRTDASQLRNIADILLVNSVDEADEARLYYKKAKVVCAIGNIMHEEFSLNIFPTEARKKIGIAIEQKLIFVPGDKRPGINWPLFHSVVEAAHREKVQQYNPIIAVGIHPGDNNLYVDGIKKRAISVPLIEQFYGDLRFSRKVPVKIYTKEPFLDTDMIKSETPSSVLVAACDLLVTACSELGKSAAFNRKPVIGFFFENLLADIEGAQQKGDFSWELGENNSADVVSHGSIEELANSMAKLLTPAGYTNMKMCQEHNYPTPPVPGSTAKKAVSIILENLKK